MVIKKDPIFVTSDDLVKKRIPGVLQEEHRAHFKHWNLIFIELILYPIIEISLLTNPKGCFRPLQYQQQWRGTFFLHSDAGFLQQLLVMVRCHV